MEDKIKVNSPKLNNIGTRKVYKIYPPVECPKCSELTDRVIIVSLGIKYHNCLCGNSWRNDNIILQGN